MQKKSYIVVIVVTLLSVALAVYSVSRTATSDMDQALPGSTKEITVDIVQAHNQPDDCWIIVGAKVYNVTLFNSANPDDTRFRNVCGTNATNALGADSPNAQVKQLLNDIEPYYIGIIVP